MISDGFASWGQSGPSVASRWVYLLATIGVAAVCVGLTAVAAEPFRSYGQTLDAAGVGFLLVACAPILTSRTWPVPSAIVALAVASTGDLLGYPMATVIVVALGLVARTSSTAPERATGMALGVFSGVCIATVSTVGADADPALTTTGGFAVGLLPALLGEQLRAQRMRVHAATELARRVAELRDSDIERAVAEERLRIARDVHDVTGHHLSAISLQAAGAGSSTSDPVSGVAFARIHQQAAEALAQTRGVLGVLRRSADAPSTLETPRLADLERILGPARAAGVDVTVRLGDDVGELSENIEMCAFRVIQESLTNTVRHAGASTATVTVERQRQALSVSVLDDGAGADRARSQSEGGGIVGMRERAALVGGSLTAGPRDDGTGWQVTALLPLGPGR